MNILDIQESTQRGLYNVLAPFFDGTTSHTINGISKTIPLVNWTFDFRPVESDPGVPVISIIGGTILQQSEEKVEAIVDGQRRLGYELRAMVSRSVFVRVGVSTGNLQGGSNEANNARANCKRTADQVYGLLVGICMANNLSFRAQSLYNLKITPHPIELYDPSYVTVRGNMTFEARTTYYQDSPLSKSITLPRTRIEARSQSI